MDKNSSNLFLFGHAVRSKRESQGLSQEALADLCQLHRTYIGGVERGERNPTLKTMIKIADSLGTTLSDLILTMEELRKCRNESG